VGGKPRKQLHSLHPLLEPLPAPHHRHGALQVGIPSSIFVALSIIFSFYYFYLFLVPISLLYIHEQIFFSDIEAFPVKNVTLLTFIFFSSKAFFPKSDFPKLIE
jgi:hypothetical protein